MVITITVRVTVDHKHSLVEEKDTLITTTALEPTTEWKQAATPEEELSKLITP